MKWVAETRSQIEAILSRIPSNVAKASKETAVEFFCAELEKIPVPFVGTILSKTLKKALKPSDPGDPDIDDVLENLDHMMQSDDDFLQGLRSLGEDVDRLNVLIDSVRIAVEETKNELTVPRLIISDPEYKSNYPVSDNELSFGLMNIGGGAVKVPEIKLVVEKWEPETSVCYSVPAAPPVFLRLKVHLSPGTSCYPLLQLNDEPFRRFGARSEGAEDVCIQMSSETNTRYQVRIHLPYKDMASNQEEELIYPPPDDPPLAVSFPFAPGWNSDVAPENMLAREAVAADIMATFVKVRTLLEEMAPSQDAEQTMNIDQKLREAGFSMGRFGMIPVLNAFIPPLTQMIDKDQRRGAVKVILVLVHQLLRYRDDQYGFEFSDEAIDALDKLIELPAESEQLHVFFKQQDVQIRKKLLDDLLKAINA